MGPHSCGWISAAGPSDQDVMSFTTHPVANVKAKAITVLGTMSCGCQRPELVFFIKELKCSLDSFQWELHSGTLVTIVDPYIQLNFWS